MSEVKTDNKNSMIQQLVTNSNLTGQALESYKAELEKLNESQLQAKLSESLNGNKASTDTQVEGLALEHNSDAVEKDKKDDDKDATTSTDADGNEIAETKENGQTIKKVITSKDKKTVTTIEYKDGKPTKKTVKKDGNTVESTTFEYTEKDGSEQVKITATGADKSKTVTTASGVDESGNVPDGKYIAQTKTNMAGATTTMTVENGHIKENNAPADTEAQTQNDVTEKTVGNKVIQYKDGVISKSVETGSDGMIAREYKKYNIGGVEYTGIQTARLVNGRTENNVVLVKNIDEDGNYSDNDIVSNTLYNWNNKVSKVIYYTNGKVSSTKTYGADEKPTSQSTYEYIPTGVVRTTTDENGTVRVIADSVDNSGNLNGIKEQITRHTAGDGIVVLAKDNNKETVLTLKKVNEDFTYNNTDITNKKEITAFQDYTDDDVPEKEKTNNALQKVINYMSTSNHVGKLTYDKSAIRNMFSSLGKEGSDYVRDDKNSTSDYTRYIRKGDDEGEIYVRNSREIKYGMTSVNDNSSEYLYTMNTGNGIRKLYNFKANGTFNGVETINDNKNSHKSVISYDDGSSDVMEYENGHEKKKLHYNTKGQFEYSIEMNWKDGNTLDSTIYTYSEYASDPKLRNTQVVDTPKGDSYVYNLDGTLKKRVMRDSVPILNKNNEVVGYAPISEMDIDANGRVTNIPHASIKYLNNGTLNAGEHFDYSQIDNDLRDTALSQLEQGYQAAIDVLESRKEGDSVLNTSYWLNEAAELFDGGTDGYIKHLKQKKAEIEQMKSRFVHGVQHGSDGDITDTSAQALRKSHGQDSSAFAAEYKKLTGKDWNNEERQKYLKFNLDTQKMQLDLQRVYDEYKKNGKLSTSAQATFNILTDGQYMQGDSKKLLKQFIKEVDGTKQKNGSVNPMASGVGSFAYGKLLEKNKSNLGNAQSDMNNATNNDKNLRDTGNVLDVLGCVLEFGLVAKGIQYAGKGIKAVSTLANVGKVAKYTARAGEFLSSELRSARVINSALHAGKDALNMAATMGTFDAASVLGNQVVTGKYDLGEVKEKGLHGAVTGAIGGAVMHYISPQIMKMYKPESTEFEDAVANLAEKAQKAGKTLTASDIAKVTSRVQMPKPTSIRGIGTILADLGANAGVFTGASATVSAFDDSEIRKMLKDSGAYTDAEIKGMSKKDLMRESLKMQGVDTDNMSDFDLTTKYFANEYENQFKGLGQMKIAEYVMAGITKHLQGGALTLGKRASNLEYEYKEGNWYKKGDKSKTPVPTEYMSAEVKQAMAYDALEARLNNRFNKYSKSPMNGREFMGMIYGQQLPEGMETKVAEGLTINIKDGKYEITDANGKTQTVDNIEGIIEAYQNGLAEAYKDDISQKIWDNFEQNNSALDKISQDAKPRTVHIKTDEKYSELKSDLTQKLQSATTGADLTALQAQVDVIQNRDMRREFSHMVDARRAEINPQFDITDLASVQKAEPQKLFAPKTATNIANQGISFKQAPNQPDYTATRIEWGKTVEETIALNKKNGINLELVKDNDGSYYLGIKDVWSDGYHRVDRNAVVMHYGDYNPSETSVNAEWAKVHSDADGKIQDCAVVANDEGARILENSYVTADGQKIDFATMKPGTAVHKDPNAVVNAVAYDKPQTVHTLEGDITTDVTMGDVDGNAYNNFKQLKKQITKGQLVANDADPNSAKFIQLVKDGKDAEALALLRQATAKSAQGTAKRTDVKPEIKLGAVATSSDLMASDVTTPTEGRSKVSAETLGTVGKDGQRIFSKDDYNKLKSEDKNVRQMPDGTVITIDAKGRTIELGKVAKANPTATAQTSATETHTDNGPIKPSKKDPFGIHGVISDEYLNQTKGTLLVKKGDDYVLSPEADKIVFDAAKQIEKVAQQAEPSIVDYMINGGFATKETLSHRCKSAQSLHDKIQNAMIDDKSGTLTLEKAINKVKDSVGVRTVNPISDIANDPRVQKFVKAGDMKSARMMAVEIESDYVLQALRHYVDLKAEGKTDMELTRISNYIGEDGIPYFTENQLHQLKVYADKKGVNMPVVERVARPSEQKDAQTGTYNDGSTTKVRESGYTALQMNFRTKDGLTYEWQYRGEALNKFAEGEHVPYDLRTNKDIIGVHTELTRLYEPMKELLTNKEKMSDEQYTEYNHYLTAHYDYLRMHELGFNDGKNPPKLPKGFDARLRAENLELLHQTAEDIKKDPEHEEKYRKEYEANLVQNTADNVTTESYTKAAEARRANRTVDQYEAKARLDMNENENDVNDIIEHCKSNDGQIRDNLVSEASSLGYMGVKPKDVMKLLDIMKNENIDSVSKEIKDLKAKNNNADIDTVVSNYINSNGKSDMSLSDRLNQANSREDFTAILNDIKKMPEGNEKQTAFISYLKKYNQWSQDPNSPKLSMDVAKDPNVSMPDENISQQIANAKDMDTMEALSKKIFDMHLTPETAQLRYAHSKKCVMLSGKADDIALIQKVENTNDISQLNALESSTSKDNKTIRTLIQSKRMLLNQQSYAKISEGIKDAEVKKRFDGFNGIDKGDIARSLKNNEEYTLALLKAKKEDGSYMFDSQDIEWFTNPKLTDKGGDVEAMLKEQYGDSVSSDDIARAKAFVEKYPTNKVILKVLSDFAEKKTGIPNIKTADALLTLAENITPDNIEAFASEISHTNIYNNLTSKKVTQKIVTNMLISSQRDFSTDEKQYIKEQTSQNPVKMRALDVLLKNKNFSDKEILQIMQNDKITEDELRDIIKSKKSVKTNTIDGEYQSVNDALNERIKMATSGTVIFPSKNTFKENFDLSYEMSSGPFGKTKVYFEGEKVAATMSDLKTQLKNSGYNIHGYYIEKLLKNIKTKDDIQKASILCRNSEQDRRQLEKFNICDSVEDAAIAAKLMDTGFQFDKDSIKAVKEHPYLLDVYKAGRVLIAKNTDYALDKVFPMIDTKAKQQVIMKLLKQEKQKSNPWTLEYTHWAIEKTLDKFVKTDADVDKYVTFINKLYNANIWDMHQIGLEDTDKLSAIYELSQCEDINARALNKIFHITQYDDNITSDDMTHMLQGTVQLRKKGVQGYMLEEVLRATYDSNNKFDNNKLQTILQEKTPEDIISKATEIGEEKSSQLVWDSMFGDTKYGLKEYKKVCTDEQGNVNTEIYRKLLNDLTNTDSDEHFEIMKSYELCKMRNNNKTYFDKDMLDAMNIYKKDGMSNYSIIKVLSFLKDIKNTNPNESIKDWTKAFKVYADEDASRSMSIDLIYKYILRQSDPRIKQASKKLMENGIIPSKFIFDEQSNYERLFEQCKTEDGKFDTSKIDKAIELHNLTIPSLYVDNVDMDINLVRKLHEKGFSNYNLVSALQIKENTADFIIKTFDIDKLAPADYYICDSFIDFAKHKNKYEMNTQEKRDFLTALLKSNGYILSMSKEMRDKMPILPKNDKEYETMVKSYAQSLNIQIKPLDANEIQSFNHSLDNLNSVLPKLNLSELKEINLSYTQNDFVRDVEQLTKNLSDKEKLELYDQCGFNVIDGKLNGYPRDNFSDIKTTVPKEIIDGLKSYINQYNKNNVLSIKDNPSLNQVLNNIAQEMPEIYAQIDGSGKFVETIKQLQKIVNTPNYQKLNNSDKKILTMATILQNTDNTAKGSAFDAFFISQKMGLNTEECQKLYKIIINSDAVKTFMDSTKDTRYVGSKIWNISGNDRKSKFDLLAFNMKEDNIFDLSQILYSSKEPDGLTRHFDRMLRDRIKEIKSDDFILYQTSQNQMLQYAKKQMVTSGNVSANVNVVRAEDIPNFAAFAHTPEAAFSSSSQSTRSMKFANFEVFNKLGDDKTICTSYIADEKNGVAAPVGFLFGVEPTKMYVGAGYDLSSAARNISDLIIEYYRADNNNVACADKGNKYDQRQMISKHIKSILNISDDEYIQRLDKLKNNLKGQTLTFDSLQKYDPELANAYKQFFSLPESQRDGLDGLLNASHWNEVLVSNPNIIAIYTKDIDKIPEEYLKKAQEENLPIVIIK